MESIFKIGPGAFYTNADAVAYWVDYKERGVAPTRIQLPDGQLYTVEGEAETSKGAPLILFASKCRVCGAPFTTARSVSQLKLNPCLVRNCAEHKNMERSPRGAWMRGVELKAIEEREPVEAGPSQAVGIVQQEVLEALDELEELFSPVPVDLLLKAAAKKAWRGTGKRDQRKRIARASLKALLRRGLVDPARLTGGLA